ncbi:MAG TPA: ArsR family transcriptional regulator [bacterium]|nr:ArsR family transcriptional regulator [bacterium]
MQPSSITNSRRRLLELLRTRGEQTIEDLTRGLDLTRSSVRSHLASLQADGYVVRRGVRTGKRRPSFVYGLTSLADALFPTAYGEFAGMLIEELKREGVRNLDALLQRVGDRWIARDLPDLEGTSGSERMRRVRDLLAARGFMPDVERTRSGYTLREHNCPLMPLAASHLEICDMVHRWLSALVGTPLQRVQCMRQGDASSAYVTSAPGQSPKTKRH